MSGSRSRLAAGLLAAAVVLAGLSLGWRTAWVKSPVLDEKIHLAGGLAVLRTGDCRIDPEHPPLLKCIAALPLLWTRPALPLDHVAWKNADTTGFGRVFFYYSGNDVLELIRPARSAMLVFSVLLWVVFFLFARRLWGDWGGLLSLSLLVFCPNMLAHEGLVATDAGSALLAAVLMAALWRYWTERGRGAAWVGLALGLVCAAKYSGLVWIPFVAVVMVARQCRLQKTMWHRAQRIGWDLLVVAILAGVVIAAATAGSLPWDAYWHGFCGLQARMETGHPGYLMGAYSSEGWIQYFAVVMALKTPVVVILALLLSLFFIRKHRAEALFTLAPAAWYLAVASLSRHDIGVRHILPVYVLLFAWLGCLAGSSKRKWGVTTAVFFLLLSAANAIRIYPDYLPYFNFFSGGRDNGYRYLNDSNLDWGQDLPTLKQALGDLVPGEAVYVDYSGDWELVQYYGIPGNRPTKVQEYQPTRGVFAVSLFKLFNVWSPSETRYRWLRMYEPVARPGGSIWVYRVNPAQDAPERLRRDYLPDRMGAILDQKAALKHLRSGWRINSAEGDWVFPPDPQHPGFRAVERDPSLAFSLPDTTTGAALSMELFFLTCPSDRQQRLEVDINDRIWGELPVAPGWHPCSIEIPREMLGPGVNILTFQSREFVFPDEICGRDATIGRTHTKMPRDVFTRCGQGDDGRVYRDLIIGKDRAGPDWETGLVLMALDETGAVQITRQFAQTNLHGDDVEGFLASLPDGQIVLGMGYLPDAPFAGELLEAFQSAGGEEAMAKTGRTLLFAGVRGAEPGTAVMKLSDHVIFLTFGQNRDHEPFAFGLRKLRFSVGEK